MLVIDLVEINTGCTDLDEAQRRIHALLLELGVNPNDDSAWNFEPLGDGRVVFYAL